MGLPPNHFVLSDVGLGVMEVLFLSTSVFLPEGSKGRGVAIEGTTSPSEVVGVSSDVRGVSFVGVTSTGVCLWATGRLTCSKIGKRSSTPPRDPSTA